jgi:predicted nuclease with TOPRIM domain
MKRLFLEDLLGKEYDDYLKSYNDFYNKDKHAPSKYSEYKNIFAKKTQSEYDKEEEEEIKTRELKDQLKKIVFQLLKLNYKFQWIFNDIEDLKKEWNQNSM